MIWGRVKGWLAGLGVVLAALLGAWAKGRSAGKGEAVAKSDKAYRETVERAKDADLSGVSSDADNVEWLRKRGDKR